ncbi:glycosyltransferase family 4 protein [Rhizomonospora bruguierae]|uniref:glycosyltransferase family 4 protein n=1 Tax=Rhizomonospora bruguierae TaxID=1581705 RepID=UPI001BCA98A2|nr:glycosyltransferase family 4 protein [Micromonospora sp. NBRC 107566]
MRTVHFVLPAGVDDPGAPSGGNRYDRRLSDGLRAAGWAVREIAAGGAWPVPDPADRDALRGSLAALPDGGLVLLDGLVSGGVPEVVAPEARRLRTVVLVHLPLADETGLAPGAAAALDARERATLRAAAAVVATSEGAARHLVGHHGLPPGRVHVAAPGVDPAPLAPGTDGASGLLCVAAVTPRKAQDVLVDALAKVPGEWHCTLVGALDRAPGYADRIRRSVDAYGLDGRVRLVGPRTGADLDAAYAAADLFMLPSLTETYGMVVTEALARGVPVLGTDVNGVPEALGRAPGGDRPGLLVPPGDPAALAEALIRWLDEPAARERLRAAARARRAHLPGWAETVRAMAAILEAAS